MLSLKVVARRIRGGVIAALFSSAVLGLSFASSALAAPLAPQTITVTAHSSFIDLAWAASEEPETPYSVWRSAVVGDTVLTAKVVGFASTNSFIDSTAIVGADIGTPSWSSGTLPVFPRLHRSPVSIRSLLLTPAR